MRVILLILAMLCLPLAAIAAYTGSPLLILTRHAEKLDGDDPCLTEQGEQRAKTLAMLLSEKDITSLLSTDYCRTRETLADVAEDRSLDIEHYAAKDSDAIRRALAAAGDGTVVVAAHSNTLPKLLEDFGFTIEPIGESRYGDLFIIPFENGKAGRLVHLRY